MIILVLKIATHLLLRCFRIRNRAHSWRSVLAWGSWRSVLAEGGWRSVLAEGNWRSVLAGGWWQTVLAGSCALTLCQDCSRRKCVLQGQRKASVLTDLIDIALYWKPWMARGICLPKELADPSLGEPSAFSGKIITKTNNSECGSTYRGRVNLTRQHNRSTRFYIVLACSRAENYEYDTEEVQTFRECNQTPPLCGEWLSLWKVYSEFITENKPHAAEKRTWFQGRQAALLFGGRGELRKVRVGALHRRCRWTTRLARMRRFTTRTLTCVLQMSSVPPNTILFSGLRGDLTF